MPSMGVLAIKSSKRDRVVLMTTSPFGLPLRVDIPNVDPTEWEDDDDDD